MIGWALHAAGIAVVVISAFTFYRLTICGLHDRKVADLNRSAQLQILQASATEVQREQRLLREQLDKLLETTAQVRKSLPQKLDVNGFVKQVRQVAERTGVRMLDYTIGRTETGPSFSSSEIRMHCSGSFASVCQLLKEINQFARATDVATLALESKKNIGEYPFQVTFVLYYGAKSHDREKGEIL